jgi:hypothetical protein
MSDIRFTVELKQWDNIGLKPNQRLSSSVSYCTVKIKIGQRLGEGGGGVSISTHLACTCLWRIFNNKISNDNGFVQNFEAN